MRSELILRLRGRQQALELTDLQMAERLGVSRAYWQAVRTGRRQGNITLLRGILAAFPELTRLALAYLEDSTQASETQQDKRQTVSDASATP